MKLVKFALCVMLAACLTGCGNKVKQTKEDAEAGAAFAEVNIRLAQMMGVEADITASYNGRSGGELTGPGFHFNTGVTGTAHFRVDPTKAVNKTPVGPPGAPQAAKPVDEPDTLTEVE